MSQEKYVGDMESIEFDENPMGLWNFEAGENNYVGARERYVCFRRLVSNNILKI